MDMKDTSSAFGELFTCLCVSSLSHTHTYSKWHTMQRWSIREKGRSKSQNAQSMNGHVHWHSHIVAGVQLGPRLASDHLLIRLSFFSAAFCQYFLFLLHIALCGLEMYVFMLWLEMSIVCYEKRRPMLFSFEKREKSSFLKKASSWT